MDDLIRIIKETAKPNFLNIKTSIKSYDRDALCCNAPAGDGHIMLFIPQTNGSSIPLYMKNLPFMRKAWTIMTIQQM